MAAPTTGWVEHSLAEKPKVEKLQMDWLRSEDLKEEKNVTAPIAIIAFCALCRVRSGEAVVVATGEAYHWACTE